MYFLNVRGLLEGAGISENSSGSRYIGTFSSVLHLLQMKMTLETFSNPILKKDVTSEDACRCDNELVHELTETKKRSGRQVETDFGQTDFGQNRLWPKPTLAKTDFGQNRLGQS